MSKARTLAGVVSTGAVLADGTIDAAEIGNLTLPTGGDIVGTTATQTLTNKTIDIASNTLTGVQASLVSGTNIKTVNSTSLLGSGDVAVQPTLVSGTNIKTIGGQSVLGSGDLTVGGGSMIFLASVTASSSSVIEFDGYFSSTYDRYVVLFDDVKGTNNSYSFCCQLFLNGSYLTSGYRYYVAKFKEGSSYDYDSSGSSAYIELANGVQTHSNSPNLSGAFQLAKPYLSDGNDVKTTFWDLAYGSPSQEYVASNKGSASVGYNYSYAVTKVKFYPSAGTFLKGSFSLYGIKNS